MGKQSGNGKTPPSGPRKFPNERVFGANAVQLSEDEASKLVGGIVEKGISDNTPTPLSSSTPRPSVLPFPLARHRSYGPHWTPNVSQITAAGSGDADDDDDGEEDSDPTNYHTIGNIAKPINSKKKKGMNLSRWREFVPNKDFPNALKMDKTQSKKWVAETQKMNIEVGKTIDDKNLCDTTSMAIQISNNSLSNSDGDMSRPEEVVNTIIEPIESIPKDLARLSESSSARSQNSKEFRLGHEQSGKIIGNSAIVLSGPEGNNVGNEAQLGTLPRSDAGLVMEESSLIEVPRIREMKPSSTSEHSSPGYEEGYLSVENQIDADNRALLERMSPEEIADAQAEIRNRINPKLLKLLKNRGLQKLEKQRNSSNGSAAGDVLEVGKHVIQNEKTSSFRESSITPSAVTAIMQGTQKRPVNGVVQNLKPKGGNMWDNWNKRVETARDLRFSLDGNAIEGDGVNTYETGNSLGQTCTTGNVAERDFLRMEGDPSAAGYTVKEALSLTRSVVPGQRTLALHLLLSILSKALEGICKNQLDCTTSISNKSFVDWEALWAYALGPEPELILSLRMALDDNHNSVVLACSKVIQCILAYDMNENFFNIIHKIGAMDLFTAPVFRSRPDIKHGFLVGGFWKYSTKPSNILPPDEEIINDKNEGENTIQDDNVVAGQDVAAGLVRMGILHRLRYLLETDPTVGLEECILSILVAIARDSPVCANAIWKCEGLVQTIVERYTVKELQASKIKSVTLLRVLAESSKSACIEFIKNGFIQSMMWQLYQVSSSIDEWVKSGTEYCKLASELMVEKLRLWKVCIMYGQCISYFTGFFPSLCLWLNPPSFDKLVEANVFHEFASISKEVYLTLEALARRLPDIHLNSQGSYGDNTETWCWSDIGPIIDTALKWLEMKSDSTLSKFIYQQDCLESQFLYHNKYLSSLLWIVSAVMHMLHTVLTKATPEVPLQLKQSCEIQRLLSSFVAKFILQIIRNDILTFPDQSMDDDSNEQSGTGSFLEKLCYFRHHSDFETSLASVCCLHGLFRVVVSIDRLIHLTENKGGYACFQGYELPRGTKILDDGFLKRSWAHWRRVLSEFTKLVSSEWRFVQSIEVFGRGGPAPGIGVGWGASAGGFWSSNAALVQADAKLLVELLQTFHSSPAFDLPGVVAETSTAKCINSALALSLTVQPGDKMIIHKVLDLLLQIPVLKYLDQCILHFRHPYQEGKKFKWEYKEDDFMHFSKILASHFRIRWLSMKKKKPKTMDDNKLRHKTFKKGGYSLDPIYEDMVTSPATSDNSTSLAVEWAHQRLPLPNHWLLSPITSISDLRPSDVPTSTRVPPVQDPVEYLEVAKAGLFFLLGIEAMSSKLSDEDDSPVQSIPLVWKLHSLSVALLVGMGILEEERSRDVYEALQSLYGQHLDDFWLKCRKVVACKINTLPESDVSGVCLCFQSEIHENYQTFIEALVEQFAAISYGDLIYGRQIAVYLHQQVEASVRLAAWNALSNARALDLLPPLDNCLSRAEAYLEAVEEDESLLEAYVKSWISGTLDRAATRGSITYTIAVHHLSSFIFDNCGDRILLRNKLVKALLRDYSRKQQHEVMTLDLIRYAYSSAVQKPEEKPTTTSQMGFIDQRFELLKEACEGNTELLAEVEKLKKL